MYPPHSILCVGDLHGDAYFTSQTFTHAVDCGVDAIVQVGDFGYWEHMPGGTAFLDYCALRVAQTAIPLFWVDGNHENHTLLRREYGPGGAKHKPTPEGFWEIRPGVYYIPRGTRWTWNEIRMMGLGGAYSVDKGWRLDAERKAYRTHIEENNHRVKAGAATRPFNPERHKLWWPEEELTDPEIANVLADTTEIDVLFTHDKPRASNPRWNRKDFPECWPNQDKIQTVATTLHPKVIIHGHLHFRYTDVIMTGDDRYTRVEGLDCNSDARADSHSSPDSAWLVVQLERDVDNANDDTDSVGEAA